MAENPWDRQRNESGRAEGALWFSRFTSYRELGPERSLLAAYRAWRVQRGTEGYRVTGVSGPWTRAAKTWHWKQRAEKWDHYQQVRRMQAEQEQIDEMNKRHLQVALGLQSAGGRSLQRLAEKFKLDPDAMLDAGEIRRFLSEGIDLERMTRGLPTEMIAIMGAIMGMSDDELLKAYEDSRAAPTGIDAGGDAGGDEAAGATRDGGGGD